MPFVGAVRCGHNSGGVFVNDSGNDGRPERQCSGRVIVCSKRSSAEQIEKEQSCWV
jgi:hypothetical protein